MTQIEWNRMMFFGAIGFGILTAIETRNYGYGVLAGYAAMYLLFLKIGL